MQYGKRGEKKIKQDEFIECVNIIQCQGIDLTLSVFGVGIFAI